MSLSELWRRLRSTLATDAETPFGETPADTEPTRPAHDQDFGAISELDTSNPASEAQAVAAFQRLVRADREDAALGYVLELFRQERCPSELLCLAARALIRRGEHEVAGRLLLGLRSAEGLVLQADVAAARGELALAVELAERALAYDIDDPGAVERLERWRIDTPNQAPDRAGVTLLSKDLPETTLRIVAELGRGGAATVYRAKDDVLGRDVALKVYHRPESDRDKLIREARMAVSLTMPGVVRIFDADPEHGWIAMEWVERGALADLLKAGASSEVHPGRGWFVDLTRTIARIHERGFVHADLKPANVLFRAPSEAVLSDFGLALPFGSRHLGASEGYVSPERQAGAPASAADDVFSLGRVLGRSLAALDGVDTARLEPWRRLAEHLTSAARPGDAGEVLPLLPPQTAEGS